VRLLRSLLRLALEDEDSAAVASLTPPIREAPPSEWAEAIETLRLHELLPYAGYALRAHGLENDAPTEARDLLAAAYFESLLQNLRAVEVLKEVCETFTQRGVDPLLWKGAVLATGFYPDLGARPMADLDLWIAAAERGVAAEILDAAGLVRRPDLDSADAVHFEHPCGVLLDVHHRVRLFERQEPAAITRHIPLAQAGIDAARVLGPDAMIAHLVVHLNGHRKKTGPLLRWILDFAPVARRWGDELDLDRTTALLPSPRDMALLLRLVGFLDRELAQPPPPAFAELAERFPPLTLPEILRQRRLAQWGLPGPLGWARLALCGLGLRSRGGRSYPHPGDFRHAPGDTLRRWWTSLRCARGGGFSTAIRAAHH
jgi:hypothetical protein